MEGMTMDTSRHDPRILANNVYETLQCMIRPRFHHEPEKDLLLLKCNHDLLEFISKSVRANPSFGLPSIRGVDLLRYENQSGAIDPFQPAREIEPCKYSISVPDDYMPSIETVGQRAALLACGLFDYDKVSDGIVPKSKEIGDILRMLILDQKDHPTMKEAGVKVELVSPAIAKTLIDEYTKKRVPEMKQAALFAPDNTVTGLHLRTRTALALQAFIAGRG